MTVFNGSAGNDSFTGASAADVAHGNAGADTLEGWGGNDQLDGGAGADLLSGGVGNDVIYSHTSDPDAVGGYYLYKSTDTFAEKDTLLGGAGDDTLVAGLGDDVDGGDGSNVLHVSFLASTGGVYADFSTLWNSPSLTVMGGTYKNIDAVHSIEGSNYDDFIKGVEGLGSIYGRGGNDHIVMTYATGDAWGGDGDDLIDGTSNAYGSPQYGEAGNDTLIGGYSNDDMHGGTGNDQLSGNSGFDSLYGDEGDDLLDAGDREDKLFGGAGQDTVHGGSQADVLEGGEGNDLLQGDDSDGYDDILRGDSGADSLYGGGGNDSLYSETAADSSSSADLLSGGDGNDTLTAGLGDDVDGGAGSDTLHLSLAAGAGPQLLDLSAVASGQSFHIGSGLVTQVEKIGSVRGAELDDTIRLSASWTGSIAYGGAGNDTLTLLGSGSKLYGEWGNDRLAGGLLNDTLDGGLGTDAADYAAAQSGVTVSLLLSAAQNTGGAGSDTLVSIENLWGSGFNDSLAGSNSANYLVGGAGDDALNGWADNDTLEGGAGIDTLTGGLGNDVFLVSDLGDVVLDQVNGGTDEVRYSGGSGTLVLSDNIENLVLLGAANLVARGNELANRLTGNAGAGTLYGMEGNDTLVGSEGDYELRGGTGNDLYLIHSATDQVVESAGEGTDEVQSAFSWTLGAGFERLTLTGSAAVSGKGNVLDNFILGNSAGNLLTGGDGADTLDGGTGADRLQGDAGNDLYLVDQLGDQIIEAAGGGLDTVQASVSWFLGSQLENLLLTSSGAINGTGNELNNRITGNSFANTLNGGLGADTLLGGAGDDSYGVDSAADVVTENANAGVDLVRSSVSWTLGANLENLQLTGTASVDANGNGLNNRITGNSGDNRLNGLGGDDTLAGGAGNDTYVVDSALDVIIEAPGAGIDTIITGLNTLPGLDPNLENLVMTGTYATFGFGNDANNQITGNAIANVIDGGLGNDTMTGGLGDDSYSVNSRNDVVVELAGGGNDSVNAEVSITLASNVENLTLIGNEAINGTGNGLANHITGNSASNIINGGLGADTMDGGGGGNDTFIVDNLGDVVMDDLMYVSQYTSIESSVSWDAQYVQKLTLTGSADINASGTVFEDTLVGNAGSNIIDGESGNDSMAGGAGNDTYIVDSPWDSVVEQAGEGLDTVKASVSWSLGNSVERLELFGSAVTGTGNASANTLTGNALSNTLSGGLGADRLTGGAGADQFVLTDLLSSDTITDFVTGSDQISISRSGITVGDADLLLEGAQVRAGPGGFGTAAELVIFTQDIAGSIDNTSAAAAIGRASGAYAVGQTQLFMVDNGSQAALYLFKAANTDAVVSASELTLLATLQGSPNIALGDVILSA